MEQQGQQAPPKRDEVEAIARHLAELLRSIDSRFEGIRSDFEVALLEQHVKFVRRMERLEGLVAERLGEDLAKELTDLLGES